MRRRKTKSARKSPSAESFFSGILKLSPEEQHRLWMMLYDADAPIVQPYKEQTDFLQERAIRGETRPPRKRRALTEEEKQILTDKHTLSWSRMYAKYIPKGYSRDALRQAHRRAEQRLKENYVEVSPGRYRLTGQGERLYPTWEAVLIQLRRDRASDQAKE